MKKIILLLMVIAVVLSGCSFNGENSDVIGKCSIEIDCSTIKDYKGKTEVAEFVPENGIIFSASETDIYADDTVFTVLQRICREEKIKLDFTKNPGSSVFVNGIGNIAAGDCSELSGWLYFINGESASEAVDLCPVNDGDVIEWKYTCDMGNDI